MRKSDLQEFTAFLLAIAEVYQRKMSDAAVLVYFDALRDMELSAIKAAAKIHCQDAEQGRFFPLPAHLRGAIESKTKRAGLVAWAEVLDAMELYGAYCSMQFTDGTLGAVIRDMGGWALLCHRQATDENVTWLEKDFCSRYEQYRDAGREFRGVLTGIHDQGNTQNGYLEAVKPPVMIGDGHKLEIAEPVNSEGLKRIEGMIAGIGKKMS